MSVEIKSLNKSYGKLKIFDKFNISFDDKQITGLLGPSGCGKTTLLNIISGLIDYDAGNINGVNTNNISYIFQEPRLLKWMTVKNNIVFVLKEIYGKERSEKIAEEYIKLVELKEFKDYYPEQLSGGMKQRVSIARAFAYPSNLLLMDEPFKGLDIALKKSLIESFLNIWEENKKTVIYISHDIDEILMIADKVVVLSNSPSKIKDVVSINIPQKKREISSKEMLKYRSELEKNYKK